MTATLDLPPRTSLGHLLEVIQRTADNAPRSLQKRIGPSEVGMPCERKLALQLLGATVHNTGADSWPATVGTAVHAWLADAFTADNARLAAEGLPPRWLVEQRVKVRTGLTGSCDLYDLWTHTVIDHKNVSVARLRAYRQAGDPGQQYRTQAHLYGTGWARAGLPVARVAVVFYPRSGVLRDTWMWDEDYDPAVADGALGRMDQLLVAMNVCEAAGDGALRQFMALLDRDTKNCDWCPFYRPDKAGDPSDGCAGPFEDPDFIQAPKQAVAGLF